MEVFLFLVSYALMEFVAWSNHKFVMHGFLWIWHRDHHVNDVKKATSDDELKTWEKNDLFFLVYAIPAIILLIIGFHYSNAILKAVGFGISAYGLTYFLLHDVYIHKRVNLPWLINLETPYLTRMKQAHVEHHRPSGKKNYVSYGLLIFPKE